MLCDREGAIADGSKVYDTCNHLEMYKEDLARESRQTTLAVTLMCSDEILRSQHLPVLPSMGSNHSSRWKR
jgi:hypothetical protein